MREIDRHLPASELKVLHLDHALFRAPGVQKAQEAESLVPIAALLVVDEVQLGDLAVLGEDAGQIVLVDRVVHVAEEDVRHLAVLLSDDGRLRRLTRLHVKRLLAGKELDGLHRLIHVPLLEPAVGREAVVNLELVGEVHVKWLAGC